MTVSKETRWNGAQILKEGWACVAQEPKRAARNRPDTLNTIMIETQLSLLRCYLPEMDRKTAELACRTILEMEGKLQ